MPIPGRPRRLAKRASSATTPGRMSLTFAITGKGGRYFRDVFGIDAAFSSKGGWGHLLAGVLLVVGGSGVLSERGELEGQSAATGLVWSGGAPEIGVIDASDGDDGLCQGLEGFLAEVESRTAVMLFVPPGGFSPRAIQLLGQRSQHK